MKKLLILTNVLWLSLFVFTGFKPLDKIQTISPSTYHLIDASLVKLMSENYREFYVKTFIKKKATVIDNSNGIQNNVDSRTIWFSKEKLTQFLNDMDAQAALHGGAVSGIRFYYIKYPDATNWGKYKYFTDPAMKLPTSYQNRHSLLLVPTYLDPTTQFHTDFDPRRFDNTTNKFVDLPTVLDELIKNEEKPIPQSSIQAYNNSTNENNWIPVTANLLPINTNTFGLNELSKSKAAMLNADNSGTNAAAANGGGIIPPYGEEASSAVMAKKSPSKFSVDVPCSGAKLMLFVDGYMTCGPQSIDIKDKAVGKTGELKERN